MKYRKLRIAWSALCLVACVSLIALWVRSYWRSDYVQWVLASSKGIQLTIFDGFVMLDTTTNYTGGSRLEWRLNESADQAPVLWHLRLGYFAGDAYVPIWLLAMVAASLSLAPRFSLKSFSLRTLLIATTLVAVVLALVVWATK